MHYSLELVMQNGCQHIMEQLETGFYWLKERGFQLESDQWEPFNGCW